MSQDVERLHREFCGIKGVAKGKEPQLTQNLLFQRLSTVPMIATLDKFNITDAYHLPTNDQGVPWNNLTIPALGYPNEQGRLWGVIYDLLQDNGCHAYNDGGALLQPTNDDAHNGPFMQLPPTVCNTVGELNSCLISNAILEVIMGYRVYRSCKATHYRTDVYDEGDQRILSEMPFLKAVLLGDVPNEEMNIVGVHKRLKQMRDQLLGEVKGLMETEPQFSAENLRFDPGFVVTMGDLYADMGWLRNSTDSITPLLRKHMGHKIVRIPDLLFILADSVKLMSEDKRTLTPNDLQGIRNVLVIASVLQYRMKEMIDDRRFSRNNERDAEIKAELRLGSADIARKVYTSLVKSLGTILKRACDEYIARKKMNNPLLTSPNVTVAKYKGIVQSAREFEQILPKINEELASHNLQPLNNTSCKDLIMLADIVSKQMGRG